MLLRFALRLGVLLLFGAAACVDPFGGSSLEVTFDPGVQTPTPQGDEAINGRPPYNTYYAFYAVNYVYETDANGHVVLDENDQPVIAKSYVSLAQRFEIRPLIDMSSPCFIEKEQDRFPGLHVTQVANKIREVTGISDPLDPPEGTPETDVTDVLTADKRMGVLSALQNTVRAVTDYSAVLPPGVHPDFQVDTVCVEDSDAADPYKIPPPNCIGAESNARRYQLCEEYWQRYPDEYEGSDRVFTVPLNGHWRGAVTGTNPKNAGFLGGAHFYCDSALEEFDALLVNWQFKDLDGDGEPDYPDDGNYDTDQQRSIIGYHYMEGTPVIKTRGVINVPLSNRLYNITAEASIIPDLGDDDTQF